MWNEGDYALLKKKNYVLITKILHFSQLYVLSLYDSNKTENVVKMLVFCKDMEKNGRCLNGADRFRQDVFSGF